MRSCLLTVLGLAIAMSMFGFGGGGKGSGPPPADYSSATLKDAPRFSRSQGTLYRDWVVDVEIWLDNTTVPLVKRGGAVYFSLEEKEKSYCRENLTRGQIKDPQAIIKALEHLGRDEQDIQYSSYRDWRDVARADRREVGRKTRRGHDIFSASPSIEVPA